MIRTLVAVLARQRLNSPMRVVMTLFFFGTGLIAVAFTGSLGALSKGQQVVFGYVIAAGLIGQEVSSGVLTLTFARPLRRSEYVVGRWIGACAIASAWVLLQVLMAAGIASLRGGNPTLEQAALRAAEGVLAVTGASAVLLMFSSLVPGLADLGLVVLALIVGGVLTAAGGHWQIAWLTRTGDEIHRFIDASLDLGSLFGKGTVSWFEITSYLSTLAICLVVAIWAVNRKELSYASTG